MLFRLSNRPLHPRLDIMEKSGNCASCFWTLASGTSAGRGAVREELGAVLLPGIDSTGVVLVDACVAVRA